MLLLGRLYAVSDLQAVSQKRYGQLTVAAQLRIFTPFQLCLLNAE